MKTNRLLGIFLLFSLLPLAALAQSLVLWNENAAIKRIDLKAKPVVKVTSDKLKVVGDGINLEYKAETVFRLTCEGISASTRSAEAKMPFRIMSMNNATNTDIEEPAVLVFHSDSLIDSYLRAQVDSISYLYSDKGKGDVNSDGSVDVADISAVISEMAGSADFKGRADVNEDGVVDVADISNVIKIMANNARRAKIATNNEADNILRIHLKEEPIDYGLNSVDSVVFTPPTKFFSILTMSEGKKTYLTATLRLQTGGRWEDWSDLQLGFVFSEKLYPRRDENARWIYCGSKPTAGVLEFKVSNKDWGVVGETTYHYQAYAHSAKLGLTIYGSREMFKLKPVTIWKNTYVKVEEDTENEGYYQAQVSAHIFGESDEIINDYPVARYGFYYDYATVKEPKREIPTSLRQEGIITEVGDIEAALHKLEPGTHYCFCAFVEIADAIYYSGPVGVETPGPSAPSVIVTTGKATDVGAASAQASYSVEVKMHDNKTHSGVVGIQYGLTPDLDQLGEDSHFDLETWNPDSLNYFATFFKMNPETTYYYRAYATIDGKRYYGNIQSFTTKAITVITYDAKDVTETTAHIDGELLDKDAVNEGDYYGFYINTTGNPGPDNSYYASAVFVEGNDGTFWWDITGLSPSTTYYYRAFITYKGVLYMGEAKSFMTLNTEGEFNIDYCPDGHHPHMISLGLSSGTKWACCNVGANVPENFGNYYAWGETNEKIEYNLSNYSYYYDSNNDGKYKPDEYIDIGTNIAGTSYDAATANWGTSWQMPTQEQCEELFRNCTWIYTTLNGVDGYKVIGENGKAIFIPAAGYRENSDLCNLENCYYWSSTRHNNVKSLAVYMWIRDSSTKSVYFDQPENGLSIRPVRKK